MRRSELARMAEAYSTDAATKEAYKDGFKAAMAFWCKDFAPEAKERRKWGTGSGLLREMSRGDVRLVPIEDSRDWRRWRVLVHNFNSTYGVYFRVQLERERREEIIITRVD